MRSLPLHFPCYLWTSHETTPFPAISSAIPNRYRIRCAQSRHKLPRPAAAGASAECTWRALAGPVRRARGRAPLPAAGLAAVATAALEEPARVRPWARKRRQPAACADPWSLLCAKGGLPRLDSGFVWDKLKASPCGWRRGSPARAGEATKSGWHSAEARGSRESAGRGEAFKHASQERTHRRVEHLRRKSGYVWWQRAAREEKGHLLRSEQ